MPLSQLILKLDAALVYAKAQDISAMDAVLDDVRERSYDVTPRQSAFFIRTACAAVEHVASAFDPRASAESAIAAIALAKLGVSDVEDLSAA
jgi:hypothetical protein